MADDKNQLPEGTDKIIDPMLSNSGTVGVGASAGAEKDDGETLVVHDVGKTSIGERGAAAGTAVLDKLRSGSEKLSGQAADKARGLVGQGLERSSEALANVSKLVGDTADGLDERLGSEYGDYARRAASAIEGAADSLASKDADELIDDTREFVRKSPGVALAGAAVIGFALARLIKSGLAAGDDRDDGGDDKPRRSKKSKG